ncbi:DUF3800 domain-containing protein [Patescibacteria group bacterium]|nr:DUF3800 domain-containing protein [Patescibacteria group bacterium]
MRTTIFIDESGTLPDTNDKFIVMIALASTEPALLTNILPKYRKKLPKKGIRRKEIMVPEFKFHYVGSLTRRKVLEDLAKKHIKIYTLIINKLNRKIADTPRNYSKLLKALIKLILSENPIASIYIDKHFNSEFKSETLQNEIKKDFPQVDILQTDSRIDSRIDLADFIAGAVLRKYNLSDPDFTDIISNKIVKEKLVKWNELS